MPIHRLYFKARSWEFNKSCPGNKGERCFISGISGELEEVFLIGSKSNSRTEIVSKPMMLEKNNLYRFCFWLKDGENEEGSETCQLQVIFDGKNDQIYQYKLNQNYISPLKIVHGWRLYDLPFETRNNSVTQLKFVVERTTLTIMHASDPEDYKNLLDDRQVARENEKNIGIEQRMKKNPLDIGLYTSSKEKEIKATYIYQEIMKKLDNGWVQQQIIDDIVNQLCEQVKKDIKVDNLVKEFTDTIDVQKLQNDIMNVVKEHMRKEK